MLFANATGFDFANVVIAIVVPWVSVVAAQQIVGRREFRREAREAFLAIHTHIEDFRKHLITNLLAGLSPPLTTLDQHYATMQGVWNARAGLVGDALVLELLFAKKASRLIGTLQEVLAVEMYPKPTADSAAFPTRPEFIPQLNQRIAELSREVNVEMRRLWKSIGWTEFPD